MILSFHPCFTGGRQIILGDRKLGLRDLRLIMNAEAIILPQSCSYELFQHCRESSAHLFPNYDVRFRHPGKVGQSLLFEKFHLPHPVTVPWHSVNEFRESIRQGEAPCHDLPFLIKANESHEGEGVFIITDRNTLESALTNLRLWEKTGQSGFICQEIIAAEGNVLRAVILGKHIITYWKRPKNKGELVTTISRNATIDMEWRKDLQRKASVQVKKFSHKTGINLAAIDFVFSFKVPDPGTLCLEINYYFGRRGLGGSLNYYRLLHRAIQEWLQDKGFDPTSVKLV